MVLKRKNIKKITVGKLLMWMFLGAGVFVSVFPFYWLIAMSTNLNSDYAKMPPKLTLGSRFFSNFKNVLDNIPFAQSMMNTLIVSLSITIAACFFCSLAGFVFAKFDFPGKMPLFIGLLLTMMIPMQLSIVPRFIMMRIFHWTDSLKALIIPGMVSAFGVFWMKQYSEGAIHDDLLHAGRIDGCGHFRLYWNIAFPLLRPALGFLGIYTFMAAWNEYIWPLIVISDQNKQILQVTLSQLKGAYSTDYAMVMSGTLVGIIPLIIFFLIFSRQFIANIAAGAIKN